MPETKSFAFQRRFRINSETDFNRIFRPSKEYTRKINSGYFKLLFQNNVLNHPRLGIIISKKNIRKATERNRLRRVIRECFRLRQHRLDSFDIVFLIYNNADKLDKKEWLTLVEKQLDLLEKSAAA